MQNTHKKLLSFLVCFMLLVHTLPAQENEQIVPDIPAGLLLDTTAVPDDALTKEIIKMMDLLGTIQLTNKLMLDMLELKKENNTENIPALFFERFRAQVNSGRVARLLQLITVRVYREKFTLEEMKELTRFYSTPTGKKIAQQLPFIYDEMRIKGELLGKMVALEIVQEMQQKGEF